MRASADLLVRLAVRRLVRQAADSEALGHWIGLLLRQVGPAGADLVPELMGDVLVETTGSAVRGGWGPADLAELVRRRHPDWLPELAAALHEHGRRHGPADTAWRAEVAAIAPEGRLWLRDAGDLAIALGLSALLAGVPLLHEHAPPGRSRPAARPDEHPKLAQVRKLLAKAESTPFGPEAEALVAKAQALVSRYALERLLDTAHLGREGADLDPPVSRRLWLDRPYVRAKSLLVHEVARANHCRSAVAEAHGFVLLVGQEADLEAVDVLVTSLLVQAGSAMLRLGHTRDRAGTRARSRAFRQSFLIAYAQRIGQRLAETEQATLAAHASALPVLRDHEARVQDAFDAMVPHTAGRPVAIGDAAGWTAGTSAADRAHLDAHARLAGEG